MQQNIQYCMAPDGVRLAYAVTGKGPLMVRTPHWFTHLEHDLTNPAVSPVTLMLAQEHRLLRYDARGVGLSQRDVDVSFDKFVADLETVIDAAKFDRFILVGLSQGCAQAIAYAARHPERVSHLVLYGGFARGLLKRGGDPDKAKQNLDLQCALVRQGWGSQEDAYRQFFTSQFMPDCDRKLHQALNEMQRHATTADMAERFVLANAEIDVSGELGKIKAPTLVLHPTGDTRVPFSVGQEIAAAIPGAKFVPLETRNHMLMGGEPAQRVMADAISDFLGHKRIRHLPGTDGISERLEHRAKALEQNWFIKFVLVFAAITGCLIFFWEVYKMWRGGGH